MPVRRQTITERGIRIERLASSRSPSTRRRGASSCCSSSPTTDGIRTPGSDDLTDHYSHRPTSPIHDQPNPVNHTRKDNSF
jgi:hypothetical protein